MMIRDFYPGDLIEEIPHELKEYGRILLEKYLRDAGYVIIPNGNHANFGMYGKQAGDGEGTVGNAAQINITAEHIAKLISE